MSRGPRLSECVAWSSTPVPRWRRAARWAPTVVGGFLGTLLGPVTGPMSGPDRTDPRVDVDEPLGVVTVTPCTIEGPWLLLAHLGTLAGWPQPA